MSRGPFAPARVAGTTSAVVRSQIVGMSRLQATPLRDGPAVATKRMVGFAPVLWPAGRRFFPILLPPIDCQVEQTLTVVHRLDAATGRPIGLEHVGPAPQVANEVHQSDAAADQQRVK